LIRKYV